MSCIASSCLSSRITRSCFRMITRGSFDSFTTALVCSVITLDANRHVDTVSSACSTSGQRHAIKVVRQLPPSESRRMCVSLDCLALT